MAWKEMLQVSAPPRKSNEAHCQGSREIRMVIGSLPPVDIQLEWNAPPIWGIPKRQNQNLRWMKVSPGWGRQVCRWRSEHERIGGGYPD